MTLKYNLRKTYKKKLQISAFDFLGQWGNYSSQYGFTSACVSTLHHFAEGNQFNKILHSYRISKDVLYERLKTLDDTQSILLFITDKPFWRPFIFSEHYKNSCIRILLHLTESKIWLLLRLAINFMKKLIIKLWHNAFQTHWLLDAFSFKIWKFEKYMHLRINKMLFNWEYTRMRRLSCTKYPGFEP